MSRDLEVRTWEDVAGGLLLWGVLAACVLGQGCAFLSCKVLQEPNAVFGDPPPGVVCVQVEKPEPPPPSGPLPYPPCDSFRRSPCTDR